MKNLKYLILLVTFLAAGFSCKKHVVEYDSVNVSGKAEFQLHYMVPLAALAGNNIYQVEVNGQVFSNDAAPLYTYNAIPSGKVGAFFTTNVGQNNIKLYKGPDHELVYDQNVELTEGKQNVVVYDFQKPPKVFDNGFPYEPVVTEKTGETAWVKFYNFLYDTVGQPTSLKLQYQWQYITDNETGALSEWSNLGTAVSFGEATGWEPVHVNKSIEISSGYGRINYRIRVIDQAGNDAGSLKVLNSRGSMVDYSDYWNAYVGRRYHHFLSGFRTASPTAAVRVFTAL
jgi:hypothetical protein